jgi:hypothetical protein
MLPKALLANGVSAACHLGEDAVGGAPSAVSVRTGTFSGWSKAPAMGPEAVQLTSRPS